jgi:hypothetical protein
MICRYGLIQTYDWCDAFWVVDDDPDINLYIGEEERNG